MTNLPETIVFDHQPFGAVTLGSLRVVREGDNPTIEGVVIDGSETSRIGAHTSTRSVVGQHRTVYGVRPTELTAGRITRVAM